MSRKLFRFLKFSKRAAARGFLPLRGGERGLAPPTPPLLCRASFLALFVGKAHARIAYPAGAYFLHRQKVGKDRPRGFAPWNPTRGFPLDLPKAGDICPRTPLRLPRAIGSSLRGVYPPPACGLRGRRLAAGDTAQVPRQSLAPSAKGRAGLSSGPGWA